MSAPLDSRQLRAFTVLARTGSFTRTGRELHLTQSAISHAMKALENDIGCRLLERQGKSVVLTQAGEQFLVHVERILGEMNRARAEIGRLGRWGTGRLRIGASTTACQHVLPGVLRQLRENFPQCVVSVQPGDTDENVAAIRAQQIDLAFNLEPRREEQLDFRPMFTDELQFIVSPSHPWGRAAKVTRSEIARQPYILYGKASYTFQMIEAYFRQDDIVLFSLIDLGNMGAIKELVKLGLGVSIVAPWTCRAELDDGSIIGLPLGRRRLRRTWGVMHWRGRRLSLVEEAFVGLCRNSASRFGTVTAGHHPRSPQGRLIGR